ncbi:hypothetical protein SAY87_019927 [Trapa incisa]|uniref:Hexosyltransferase n=1 Tax=Trapa incisa TaxID=236973 RepID=A0AAN7Q2Y6_9MYRT|nr:hypothetical protein SAY87_019927 [Trapa incisa]
MSIILILFGSSGEVSWRRRCCSDISRTGLDCSVSRVACIGYNRIEICPKILANLSGALALLQLSFSSVLEDRFDFKSRRKKRGIYSVKILWTIRFSAIFSAVAIVLLLSPSFQSSPPAHAIRSSHLESYLRLPPPTELSPLQSAGSRFAFRSASTFTNAGECGNGVAGKTSACDPSLAHVAITLDVEYLRGSIAAVHSILQHTSCPENVFFHFLVSETSLGTLVRSTFPKLKFKVYYFDPEIVRGLISSSVRQALEQPLNYARNYIADLLEPCVRRVIYLDSDLVVVDDIFKLWSISLSSRTIGAPEYCHANFTKYFTDRFWSDKQLSRTFAGRRPCYFNTGVMVIDLARWRRVGYTRRIEQWMEIQKGDRIYELGSLPPFLLVFAGHVAPIELRWNQHGLGGDNVRGSCRDLHPGPVSLLHWSGSGKPWLRLDSRWPCPLDSIWAPYDLHEHSH